MKIKLNEDLFDDVEVPAVELDSVIETADEALPGPELGEDNGLANLIIDTINDEWEAIQGYNILKANIGSHSDFVSIIDDIAAEENNHVGMLQQMLQQISPNTEVIQQGEEEAKLELNEDFDADEEYKLEYVDLYGSTFKDEIFYDLDDAISRAMAIIADKNSKKNFPQLHDIYIIDNSGEEVFSATTEDQFNWHVDKIHMKDYGDLYFEDTRLDEDFNYDTLKEAISGIFDAVDSKIIAEDLLEMVPEDMLSQVVKKLCQKYGVDCNF